MNTCTYSPQISPGNPDITPMSNSMPLTIVRRSTVLFQFPYDSPTTTLELKTPALNDQKTINLSRLQRHSAGRTLIVYRDPNWPTSYSLNMAFEFLSKTKADEIISFVKLTLGKEIKYTDYESQVFRCLITNPRNFISEEISNCGYTWKVDLQGVLV